MYAEERQHAIATLVAERGRVAVTAVAEQFGVTTETVRRDLALLERAGLLRRVHGGAVPAGALTLVEPGPRRAARHPGREQAQIAGRGARPAARRRRQPDPRRRQHHRGPGRRCSPPTGGCTWPPTPSRSPPGSSVAAGITLHVLGGRVRGVTQSAVGESTRPGAGRPAGRRRLPGRQRHQRRARLHHPRRGRGRDQAGHGPRRRSGSSCWPTAASSAASTWCASRPSTTSTSWSPTTRPIPAVVAELEHAGIEVARRVTAHSRPAAGSSR